MTNYHKRLGRMDGGNRGPIGNKTVLPAQDRYGYIAAKTLGLEIPPKLEARMQAWKAIQGAQRYKQRIPQSARDRILATEHSGPGPSAAADDAELRRAAQATIAKYA
jgi:hypothetical protein